jgi:DNA-binding LacI/PurR family transcriptional regulator
MPALKDIAREAGVNISTVSKALLGRDDINKDTAAKIRSIAIKLGYEFDKKKKKDLKVIGVLCPEIISNYYSQLLSGIEDEIKEAGYSLFVGFTDHIPENEKHYLEKFSKAKVDGMLYISENPDIEGVFLSAAKASGTPVVAVAQNSSSKEFDCVQIDDRYGVSKAVEYLISMGHTMIGYIGDVLSESRKDVFIEELKKHSIKRVRDWIYTGNTRFEQCGYEGMTSILSKKSFPSAIFAAYDDIAIGAVKKMREEGFNVPDDFSIASIDDIRIAAYMHPGLTTVASPVAETARTAVKTLVDRIEYKNSLTTKNILLNPELVIRESVKRIL